MSKLLNVKLSIFSLFYIILASCDNSQIKRKVALLHNSHIELMLDSMVQPRSINEMISVKQSQHIYISYIDSMSCESCAFSHFADWELLAKDVNTFGFNYIFIVMPPQKDRERVIRKMSCDLQNGKRVYIDTTGVFEKTNPQLPKEKILHTFLIDKNHNIILVGSPFEDERIKKMFKQIVNGQLLNKKNTSDNKNVIAFTDYYCPIILI